MPLAARCPVTPDMLLSARTHTQESTILKSAMMPVKLVCRRLDDESPQPSPSHHADASATLVPQTLAGRHASSSEGDARSRSGGGENGKDGGGGLRVEAEMTGDGPGRTHTVLLKTSQDLRRDQLIVSLIELMDMLLQREGVRNGRAHR